MWNLTVVSHFVVQDFASTATNEFLKRVRRLMMYGRVRETRDRFMSIPFTHKLHISFRADWRIWIFPSFFLTLTKIVPTPKNSLTKTQLPQSAVDRNRTSSYLACKLMTSAVPLKPDLSQQKYLCFTVLRENDIFGFWQKRLYERCFVPLNDYVLTNWVFRLQKFTICGKKPIHYMAITT